jgi:hypothetical protein
MLVESAGLKVTPLAPDTVMSPEPEICGEELNAALEAPI